MPNPREPDSISDYYPHSIWRDAEAEWNALPAAEREAQLELPALGNPDFVLSSYADDMVMEMEDEDLADLEWPADGGFETAWRRAHYPPEIWAEAETAWAALEETERAEYEADLRAEAIANVQAERMLMRAEATTAGLFSSLSLFDLLWVVLAVGTAAKLGYGEGGASREAPDGASTIG